MPPPALRPENALKRADELISVDQHQGALQSLYEYLTARRIRWAQPSAVEPIVFRFLELGVELKKGKLIKDGLHQYKKLVQGTPEGLVSVGAVARKYIDLVEAKMASEQAKADETQKEEEDEDLESGVTPENLLLSVYQTDQSIGGFNDEAVTSWMKFTWESYRAVLDLLRNNSQLEITYSGVVNRSMNFCVKYQRKNEFKRLAEMLRQHLDAANYQQSKSGNNIVDLSDAETLQRYLDQRFHLVNACVKLELWHEAFKAIDDVYHLMKMSTRPTKPSTLANYYENLAKVFFVSGNQTLHTAAWEKFYKLYTTNKNATEEQLSYYSSIILLSALAVQPDFLPTVGYDPHMRLYRFLDFDSKRTRKDAIDSALQEDTFKRIDPDIKDLYELLEVSYNFNTIKEDLAKLLPKLEKKSYFAQYSNLLGNVIMRKLIVSASQLYTTVDTDELYAAITLPAPWNLNYWDIEKALLQAAIEDYVSFSIDHASNSVTFAKDPFEIFAGEEEQASDQAEDEEEAGDEQEDGSGGRDDESEEAVNEPEPVVVTRNTFIRNKLAQLSETLEDEEEFNSGSYLEKVKIARQTLIKQTQDIIDNAKRYAEERAKKSQEQRQKNMASAAENAEQDAEERQQRMMEEKAAIEAKMEEDAQRRLVERKRREFEALKEVELKKFIKEINEKGHAHIDPEEAKNLDITDIRKIIVEQLSKDKQDLEERMNYSLKKLDHTERALRKVEQPALQRQADELSAKDATRNEDLKARVVKKAKDEHDARVADHDRLTGVFGDYLKLKDRLQSAHDAKLGSVIAERRAALEQAKQARIDEIRRQRYEELVAQREEEAARIEKEERARKQAEATRKQDEILQRQREQEELALKKQQEKVPGATAGAGAGAGAPATFAERMRAKHANPFGAAQKPREELDRAAERQRQMEEAAFNKQSAAESRSPFGARPSNPFGAAQKPKEELDRIAERQRQLEEAALNKSRPGTTSPAPSPATPAPPAAEAPKSKGGMTFAERLRAKRAGGQK